MPKTVGVEDQDQRAGRARLARSMEGRLLGVAVEDLLRSILALKGADSRLKSASIKSGSDGLRRRAVRSVLQQRKGSGFIAPPMVAAACLSLRVPTRGETEAKRRMRAGVASSYGAATPDRGRAVVREALRSRRVPPP